MLKNSMFLGKDSGSPRVFRSVPNQAGRFIPEFAEMVRVDAGSPGRIIEKA